MYRQLVIALAVILGSTGVAGAGRRARAPRRPAPVLVARGHNINSNVNGATNGSGGHESPRLLAGLAADVASQGMRVPQDLSLVAQLAETRLHGGLINDRKYLVCLD